jgi:hypothetical protein
LVLAWARVSLSSKMSSVQVGAARRCRRSGCTGAPTPPFTDTTGDAEQV